jgi:hypothetical protein
VHFKKQGGVAPGQSFARPLERFQFPAFDIDLDEVGRRQGSARDVLVKSGDFHLLGKGRGRSLVERSATRHSWTVMQDP